MQVAWGLLLGRMSGRDDVVFGVTVAGRPSEIAGIESMVGLFINTLPLRIKLPPSQPLLELLKQVQDSQSRLIAHQHLGLAEIQQLAGSGALFDSLVVFENYPVERGGLSGAGGGLRLASVSGHDATHYPLSLMVAPSERLQLRLDYRPHLFGGAGVEAREGRWGDGWFGCWKLRLRRPRLRSGGWIFCRRGSAIRSCKSGTRRSVRCRQRRCRSCLRRRRPRRRTRLRSCLRAKSSATASWRCAPTSWRITCARSGLERRAWWGRVWSARGRWWLRSPPSSRPAPPICRSTPATRASV